MGATGVKVAPGVALAVSLAGCAAPSYPVEAPSATVTPTPGPGRRLEIAPEAPPPRSLVPGPPRAAGHDACGAAQMQGMIGRSRSLIPVPLDPNRQRVACTTCPAATDDDPGRLNFLFDAETGVIKQVRCG